MYQLTDDPNIILRLDDQVMIPKDHRWWNEYQEWLRQGNIPNPIPVERKEIEVRSIRNQLLRNSDWTQLADNSLTALEKTAWIAYRQLLREIPQQAGFPYNINWPTSPLTSPNAGDERPEDS